MGTSRCDYVVAGMKYNCAEWNEMFKDVDTEEHYDWLECHSDNAYKENITCSEIAIIEDGMNGEYVLVGKIIAKAIDGSNGFDITNLAEIKLVEVENIKKQIHKMLDDKVGLHLPIKMGIWLVSHWH